MDLNIMVDIEGLSLKPGGKLLQIAMVPFQLSNNNTEKTNTPFNKYINRNGSNNCDLFFESKSTVSFWDSQPENVKQIVFQGTDDIDAVLSELTEYLKELRTNGNNRLIFWGNRNGFDFNMLTTAFENCMLAVPWQFYDWRDVATIYEVCKDEYKIDTKRIIKRTGAHHDALDDCIYQIQYLKSSLLNLRRYSNETGKPLHNKCT